MQALEQTLCAPWSTARLKEQTCTCIHLECFRSCDIFKFRDWWGVNLVPATSESCLSCFVLYLTLHFLPVPFDTPPSTLFSYLGFMLCFSLHFISLPVLCYAFPSTSFPYLFYVTLFPPLNFPTCFMLHFSLHFISLPVLCYAFPPLHFPTCFMLRFSLHFISLSVLCYTFPSTSFPYLFYVTLFPPLHFPTCFVLRFSLHFIYLPVLCYTFPATSFPYLFYVMLFPPLHFPTCYVMLFPPLHFRTCFMLHFSLHFISLPVLCCAFPSTSFSYLIFMLMLLLNIFPAFNNHWIYLNDSILQARYILY
jgi:hypothetical protein